ncbi:Uncharacterized protein SCF082_LOCUS7617 [Durusdinium trenchii]|uniref:Uncharacterized protein n=1 Tax=Durusdinium trenchii TaxID=1381693 RepID=A0ABP0IKN5_9DINO
MFDCMKRSAGKAQSLKLSLERWNYECDMACLGGYVLHEMQQHRNEENLHVFPAETIALLMSRFIEGTTRDPLPWVPESQYTVPTGHDDWKKGGKMMGKVRPYDPVPPPQEKVTTSDFPLKLAKMTVDGSKKGIEKYVITLSNEIRSMHLDHPVHGGVWRDLIVDFDKKFCAACTPLTDTQIVPVEEEEPEPTPFTSEPTNIEDLQAKYLVENKMPGRVPGSTLFLTTAVQRNGEKVEMVEGQSFKLWLVAHQDIEIDSQEFQLAHGKSTWLKPDRIQKLLRENTGAGEGGPTERKPCFLNP